MDPPTLNTGPGVHRTKPRVLTIAWEHRKPPFGCCPVPWPSSACSFTLDPLCWLSGSSFTVWGSPSCLGGSTHCFFPSLTLLQVCPILLILQTSPKVCVKGPSALLCPAQRSPRVLQQTKSYLAVGSFIPSPDSEIHEDRTGSLSFPIVQCTWHVAVDTLQRFSKMAQPVKRKNKGQLTFSTHQ